MSLTNNQNNKHYLNTLRVFAMFGVVMIHVFAPINTRYASYLTSQESYICIIWGNLWQWSVPVFVMITGVLFLDPSKNITIGKIIKRYFIRIIIAIIIFNYSFQFLQDII
jgi:surface polysaccharide O-acyltransferase-like enzyme